MSNAETGQPNFYVADSIVSVGELAVRTALTSTVFFAGLVGVAVAKGARRAAEKGTQKIAERVLGAPDPAGYGYPS